jgi:hypothetical protein
MMNITCTRYRNGLAWAALLLQLAVLAEPSRAQSQSPIPSQNPSQSQSQNPSQSQNQTEGQEAVPKPTTSNAQPTPPPPYKPPNLNPTQVPSAYVAEWGNYFVSSSIYGYESGNGSSGLTTDGAVSVGIGAGNARRFVAVEVDFNLESLANTNNGGSLDVRLGRELIGTHTFALQLGAGWLGIASYGNWPQKGGSPYGVLTAAWPLRPNNPDFRQTMQVNLGGGGGRFQRLDAVDLDSSGLIASVGVELAPNIGISAGWAGRGLNATLSYVPLRATPLYLSVSGANITNVDGTGRAVALSISWGGSFRTATFP